MVVAIVFVAEINKYACGPRILNGPAATLGSFSSIFSLRSFGNLTSVVLEQFLESAKLLLSIVAYERTFPCMLNDPTIHNLSHPCWQYTDNAKLTLGASLFAMTLGTDANVVLVKK